MGLWIRLCEAADVPVGQMRAFSISELSFPILVTRMSEERYLASSSICPHEDVSLLGGDVRGCVITCPGHGYEFDLETGRCAHDTELRLPRFPTRVVNGVLFIELVIRQSPS
jgi:nitrite reductase/ring-hydroxylating ferredoxin subunit